MASLVLHRVGSAGSDAAIPGFTAAMTAWGASGRSTRTRLGPDAIGASGTTGGGGGAAGAFHDPKAASSIGVSSAWVTSPAHTSVARSGRHAAAYARRTSSSVIAFALCGVPSQGCP